jgi:periplasmic divalent cation tolerance protein
MNEETEVVIVFITASSRTEANKIARILIEKRKAACVNIVSNVESIYWWRGKIESALESLLIVKTLSNEVPGLIKEVKLNHSYQVPEIVAIPIVGGDKTYLNWLREEIKPSSSL